MSNKIKLLDNEMPSMAAMNSINKTYSLLSEFFGLK